MKKMARPTKYRKEMCERIPDLMAEGMSKVEVCAELGIHYSTFLDWQKNIPEFSESVKTGEQLSAAWWEKQGRTNLENKEFQAALWYMNMKNRFKWADKQQVEHTGKDGGPIESEIKGTMSVEEAARVYRETLKP